MVGNSGAMLKVKALSSISIDDVELGIGDADQSTAPKVSLGSTVLLVMCHTKDVAKEVPRIAKQAEI